MRILSPALGVFLVLSTIGTTKLKDAVNANEPAVGPECTSATLGLQSPPPLPYFFYNRMPWDGVMREEEYFVVGELVVDCLPNTGAPVFELLPPTPGFVTIVPFTCPCLDQLRAYVIVFPRHGDRGTYNVLIAAGGCGAVPGRVSPSFSFKLRVKKATQE